MTPPEGQGPDTPSPTEGSPSLPAPRRGTAPPTCACREVPAAGLALASSWGRGRCSLDLVLSQLVGRNRKPGADHTAIARFPALPPLPASPRAQGRHRHTALPQLGSPQPRCPSWLPRPEAWRGQDPVLRETGALPHPGWSPSPLRSLNSALAPQRCHQRILFGVCSVQPC